MNNLAEFINTTSYNRNNNYEENSSIIGDSINNAYIPFYSLFKGKVLTIDGKVSIVYSMISSKKNVNITDANHRFNRRYDQVINTMKYYTDVEFYRTGRRNPKMYAFSKGILFHVDSETKEYHPLLSLAVKSSYLDSIKLNTNSLDYSKFVLIVDTSFIKPKHNLMYRNIKRLYIDPIIEGGLDVIYTKNIKNWLFNTFNFSKDLKSLPDLIKHLRDINNNIFNE